MLLFRSSSLEVSSLSDSFRFCCWKTSPLHNLSGMKRVFKHIINLSEKIVSSSTLLPFFTSINLMQINQEMRNFLGFLIFLLSTLFENYSKCRIWIFEFWHLSPIFVLSKLTSLVTLYDRKLQVFKNSPKWTIFGLSTQNVNVARFARNVEWDFFCDFQTPWRSKVVFEKLKTFCGWYSGTVSSLLSQDKSRFSCQKQFSRPFQKLFQPSSWKRTSKSWPPPLSFLLSRKKKLH